MSLRSALGAGGSLSALAAYRRFILYRLEWLPDRGKWNKVPIDYRNGAPANAHDPAIQAEWGTACDAAEIFGEGHGVGFVFNAADGFWFLDIDNCAANGAWSELAESLVRALPGAALEISVSGKGLHLFGRGAIPLHGCKNIPLGLEFYHDGRFCALTGTGAQGDAATDCTAGIAWLVQNYFPPSTDKDFAWTDAGIPESEDEKLLNKMLKAKKSAGAAFGNTAGFQALWNADATVLSKAFPDSGSRAYDASSADMALAQHLAFWCRKDCAQMLRLMAASKLKRDKWVDRPEYVYDTISKACARQTEVYQGAAPAPVPPSIPIPGAPAAPVSGQLRTDATDYVFYLPSNKYIFLKTGEEITKEALLRELDSVTIAGIDLDRRIICRAWDPTEPQFTFGRVMAVGTSGWIDSPGATTMNTFIPSNAVLGDAALAGPWLEQVVRLYPDHWYHVVCYFAWLAQHPGNKPNHGIVMGGMQGIGKDSILAGPKYAIGDHNCQEIYPHTLFSDFTNWTKCILLRINEATDASGDNSRQEIYERLKTITTSPPETLTFNDKHVKSYPVRNCMGVVITTNSETGAMVLPRDDRRYFVIWSKAAPEDYSKEDWEKWYAWFNAEGKKHVAALLMTWDLTGFNPKAPPERTEAWHSMVSSSVSEGDNELSDALDAMGNPPAVTLGTIRASIQLGMSKDLFDELNDRKLAKKWHSRLASAGYTVVRNPDSTEGAFVISGRRTTIFAKRELSEGDRVTVANALAKSLAVPPPPPK